MITATTAIATTTTAIAVVSRANLTDKGEHTMFYMFNMHMNTKK